MKISKLLLLFTTALLLTLSYSCDDGEGDDGTDPSECTDTVSYMSDVVPIISATCAIPNCHVSGFIAGDYTSYEELKAQDDAGVLENQVESGAMPPPNTAGPATLTDSEKATILCWIEQGALEN